MVPEIKGAAGVSDSGRRLRRWAGSHGAELIASLAPLLVYWRLIVGGQVLYWGLPALQFVPWRVLVHQALAQGHWPLWTPLLGMGAPVLANYQSAALYPPNLLALAWPPESSISILAVLHLSWAGLGMARLARKVGLGQFGAATAGLAFGLSGYLTGRLWFITIDNAIAWLPWIVMYSPDGAKYRPRYFLSLTAAMTLQLLAGHAQSAFYTVLLAGGWITWQRLISNEGGPASRRLKSALRSLTVFGLAGLLAATLSAVQLVPTYELLRLSPRASAAGYEFATTYSLWPWRLLTFVIPNLFGHPADRNYWGYATFWEDNAYQGLLPLIFAAYALYTALRSAWQRLRRRVAFSQPGDVRTMALTPFLVGLGIVSVILALGKNTPVFPLFYRVAPGFGLFQAPARMLIWYTFGLSLLAGIGAQQWGASDRKRYWSRLGIAGSLATLSLGVAGTVYIQNPRAVTLGAGLAWSAAFGVVVFALFLFQSEWPGWQGAALFLMIADLGISAVRATPTSDPSLFYRLPAYTATTSRLFEFAGDEYRVKFRDLMRFQSFDPLEPQAFRDSLLTNLNVLSGQASANNFDPLLPARLVGYLKAMEGNSRLLDLANVGAIVKPAGAVTPRAGVGKSPRVVYTAQQAASPEAALVAISRPDFDPDKMVILEPASDGPDFPALALDPQRLDVSVQLAQPGYVVVSDSYYPGWQAWVDGLPEKIFPADVAFRAVAVPAGRHTITMEYRPFSVTLGLIVSTAGLIVFLGLAAWAYAGRRAAEVR